MWQLVIRLKNNNRFSLIKYFILAVLIHVLGFMLLSLFFTNNSLLSAANMPLSNAQTASSKAIEVELKEFPIIVLEDDIIEFIKKKEEEKKPEIEPLLEKESKEESKESKIDDSPTTSSIGMVFERTYIGEVMARLTKNKYYPESERRREREGEVVVSFIIHPNGETSNIKIKEQTPYSLLNKAAIETINRSSPFPSFDENKKPITVVLAIDYTLNE